MTKKYKEFDVPEFDFGNMNTENRQDALCKAYEGHCSGFCMQCIFSIRNYTAFKEWESHENK